METRQEICAVFAMLFFFFGAGAADGANWYLSPIFLVASATCAIIGRLDKKRTRIDKVLKDWRVH